MDEEEKTEEEKEIDEKLEEAGIDPDDPILDDGDKEGGKGGKGDASLFNRELGVFDKSKENRSFFGGEGVDKIIKK